MIAINGRFLSQPTTGVQRYARELIEAIDKLLINRDSQSEFIELLAPRDVIRIPPYTRISARIVGSRRGHPWEQIDLPRFCNKAVLFTPSGGAPLIHKKHIITIPDVATIDTPNAYSFSYRTWYSFLHQQIGKKALAVLTVSEFSRQRIVSAYNIPAELVHVTPLSGEHILRVEREDSILDRYSLPSKGFILAVSSRNPNKNFHALTQAIPLLKNTGLLVAVAGSDYHRTFRGAPPFPPFVRELGYVSDSELRSLYEHAACFVFPSTYEGFGLPPLEALTLGCPIVVGNSASLPEVFGEAAIYCDPFSPQDIATQISLAIGGSGPGRGTALRHAAMFTWEKCAERTWAVLLDALNY